MSDVLEIPCTACGFAAAEITPPKLDAVSRYGLVKLLKLKGATVDSDSASFGFTGSQFAAALGVRCIPCVAAGRTAPTADPEAL